MRSITQFIKNFITKIFTKENRNTPINPTSLSIKEEQPLELSRESELHIKIKTHLKKLVELQQYEEIKDLLSIYPDISPTIIEPLNKYLVSVLTDDSYKDKLGLQHFLSLDGEGDEKFLRNVNNILDIVNTNVEFRKCFFHTFNKLTSPANLLRSKVIITYSIFSTCSYFFLTFDKNDNIINKKTENNPELINKFQNLCFNALDDYFTGNNPTPPILNSAIIYSYLRNNPQYLHSEKMLVADKEYINNSWFFLGLSRQKEDILSHQSIFSHKAYDTLSNKVQIQLSSKHFEAMDFNNNNNIKEEHITIINQINKEKLKNISKSYDLESLQSLIPNLNLSLKSEILLNNVISNIQKMKHQNLNIEENHNLKNIEDSIFEYFSNHVQISEILSQEDLEKHSTEYITNINQSLEDLINNISTNKIDSLKRNLKISKTIR